VPAALDDLAMIDDDDQVGVADCRQPVGDHNARPALHSKIESLLTATSDF
jgi:hypothetical protein